MPEPLQVILNGNIRTIPDLSSPTTLSSVVEALGLKADRIAVERNGEISPRSTWPDAPVVNGDRLEIVHFVGGG